MAVRKKKPGVLRLKDYDVHRPPNTPGPHGFNDKASPNMGSAYRAQLRQLHIEIGKRLRARAVTNWALNFFKKEPDIPELGKALSAKIDNEMFAVNRLKEYIKAGFVFHPKNLTFRRWIDFHADLYLKQSRTSWLITYRIPRMVAVGVEGVENRRGYCEEHAFLAVYLLTIGHMVQNMPFGKLKKDIYYTGAATPKHAMVILVKGAEFKDAILAARKPSGIVDVGWLVKNTNRWGKSAWIVDGWDAKKSKKLTNESVKLDYTTTQEFRRDPKSGGLSKWDVTVFQMVERVKKDYKL